MYSVTGLLVIDFPDKNMDVTIYFYVNLSFISSFPIKEYGFFQVYYSLI